MQKDQQASEDEVVQHRMGGDIDQGGAVVIGNELDPRRQCAVGVHLFDFGLDAGQTSLV